VAAKWRHETSPAVCDGIFRLCITALLGTLGLGLNAFSQGGDAWRISGVMFLGIIGLGLRPGSVAYRESQLRWCISFTTSAVPRSTSAPHIHAPRVGWVLFLGREFQSAVCFSRLPYLHISISLFFSPGIDSRWCLPPRCRSRSCLQEFDLL
jgi:hypothetical protein